MNQFTINIIIIVVGALVVITLITTTNAYANDATGDVACKIAIEANQKGKIKLNKLPDIDYVRDIQDSCTFEPQIIPEGPADATGVKYQIAQLVAKAWWITGEGKFSGVWDGAGFTSRQCAPLFHFELDSWDDYEAITGEEFYSYLESTEYKEFSSYVAYVQDTSKGQRAGAIPIPEIVFEQNKPYTLWVFSPKGEEFGAQRNKILITSAIGQEKIPEECRGVTI